MAVEDKIERVELLTDIFGRFPSFHDSEVVWITLDRGNGRTLPHLDVQIHVFEMTSEITDGKYVLKNHTLATFRFAEIDQLVLEGFNHQNVLWNLHIVDISNRQLEALKFEVTLAASFGVQASFFCKSISLLDVVPFSP